ncbi:hypothetical protein IAQ61_006509 [Plenodomus lingam]|uniref:uncharacterized protein n=1 Tax=Leptosphaeria maculans TaxID=5022 RepID=UPI0033192D85|nr:hypothetical protein IAQ61_006509 [Plenodomus lingam]
MGLTGNAVRPTDPSTRDLIYEAEMIGDQEGNAGEWDSHVGFMMTWLGQAQVCHDMADSGPVVSYYEMQTTYLLPVT